MAAGPYAIWILDNGEQQLRRIVDAATLEPRVAALEGKVALLEAADVVFAGQIAALQAADVVFAGQIAALQAAVTGLAGQIVALQAADVAFAMQVAALQAADAVFAGQVAALQAADVVFAGQIATLQADVAALQASDATQAGQIAALQASDATQAGQIAALQTAVANVVKVYNSGGLVAGAKLFFGTATVAGGAGAWSLSLAPAGFTVAPAVFAWALRNTATLVDQSWACGRTRTTVSVTGSVVDGVTVVLASPSVAYSPDGTEVAVLAIGT